MLQFMVCVWYYFTYRKSYRCYSSWCVCGIILHIGNCRDVTVHGVCVCVVLFYI